MELLDLLEQRVGELLDEVLALRDENRCLREDVAMGQHRLMEITALQDELAREKQIREQALMRVDGLLRRIQTSLDDASETSELSDASEAFEDNPFVINAHTFTLQRQGEEHNASNEPDLFLKTFDSDLPDVGDKGEQD